MPMIRIGLHNSTMSILWMESTQVPKMEAIHSGRYYNRSFKN